MLEGYPNLNGLHYKRVHMGYPNPNFAYVLFWSPIETMEPKPLHPKP